MSANKGSKPRLALRTSLSANAPSSRPIRARSHAAALACAALVSIAALAATQARAGLSGLERLLTGVDQITALEFAPGDDDRIFVASRYGDVRIFHRSTNTLDPTPFLTIPNLDFETEGGLLGLTFDPDYQTNGKFYVNVTVDNGNIPLDDENTSPFSTHIRQYSVSANPNVASAAFNEIDQWIKPQAWHNGGWMHFGPDGYLYLLTGDGGAAFDIGPGHTPGTGNAQDLTDNRLGKLLRIDVHGDDFPLDPLRNYAIPPNNPFVSEDGDDEIFAYGFRCPWRASFDRATGDLWIGDVGEAWHEEINLLPAGTLGGQNYGWNQREGSEASPVGGPLPGAVDPVYDYDHTSFPGDPQFEGNSVTGGYRYRGPDPTLQGKYLFADFATGQFWTYTPDDSASGYGTVENVTSQLPPSASGASYFTTFGEDEVGNLYVATVGGSVFRIVTDEVTPGDFKIDASINGHDLAFWKVAFGDASDIADANGDGDSDGEDFLLWQQNLGWSPLNPAPPATPGDFERDDDVDLDDLAVWQDALGENNSAGDANGDGDSDGVDFLLWQKNFSGSALVPEPITPGDFQRDHDVDLEDLALWQSALGTLSAIGDANGDGRSDGADFLLWQQNFGASALAAQLSDNGEHAVPEPPAGLLLSLALTAAASIARNPRRTLR